MSTTVAANLDSLVRIFLLLNPVGTGQTYLRYVIDMVFIRFTEMQSWHCMHVQCCATFDGAVLYAMPVWRDIPDYGR